MPNWTEGYTYKEVIKTDNAWYKKDGITEAELYALKYQDWIPARMWEDRPIWLVKNPKWKKDERTLEERE